MRRCFIGAFGVLLALLLFPASVFSTSRVFATVSNETPASDPEQMLEKPASPERGLNASQTRVRAEVASAFPDVPQMSATEGVVACESHFRQFDSAGNPLISPTNDVGVMQVNIPTWGKKADALGLDIYNSERDNIIMGRIVYEEQGITAWTCAK